MTKTHFPFYKDLQSRMRVENKDEYNKELHGYERNRYQMH